MDVGGILQIPNSWRAPLFRRSDSLTLLHMHLFVTMDRTSFDKEEKKHWLNCHKGDLVGRYMLQDNRKPAWHSDSKSTPEKICDAVDAMIARIDAEAPHTE